MSGRESLFPFPRRRDVFAAMDDVRISAELYKLRAQQDGSLTPELIVWLADRVLNVIQTITDANVTYGLVDTKGQSVTEMMVERDAVVAALDAPTAPIDRAPRWNTTRLSLRESADQIAEACGQPPRDEPYV